MRFAGWVFLAVAAFLLAGCSGPTLPFEKDKSSGADDGSLVKPPWEAYIQAGPGAEKDVDLETLDGPDGPAAPPPGVLADGTEAPADAGTDGAAGAQPATPPQAGQAAAADSTAQNGAKGADGKQQAVAIRFVAVPQVHGGNAKSNAELTAAMRSVLKEAGWPVLEQPREDALTIRGQVTLLPASGGNQTVRLAWTVETPQGHALGDVKQQNQVPAGSLDGGWGENAQYAAEGAAEGIFKLIQGAR